jgi:hypothetical protein
MPDPSPSPPFHDRKKQIIAAKNILFGAGYFLILNLPEGWRITRSYLEPDVHSTIQRGWITWVEAGEVNQIVFHPQRKIAVDLLIQIKRGNLGQMAVKEVEISSQGQGIAGGHPAFYCFGEVREGLLKKKIRKTLRVSFYCPELQHTIFLHFTGKCQEEDLREIYNSLAGLECH